MKVIAITPLIAGLASATPFFFQPTVDPNSLRRHITRAGLLKHVYKLQEFADADEKGNRGFGGTGHKKTVDYIVKWFKQWPQYYKVETQEFVHEYSAGSSELTVEGETIPSKFFTYSPSGKVTEALVPAANLGCQLSDFPPEVAGKIALISRGTCEFGLKVALAGASGAKGAIIYNNAPGELSGTLGAPSRPQGPYVPVASITQDEGKSLLTDIQAGAVLATLNVDAVLENRTTHNVFATTKGGDQNNVVQLGGHTDSIVGAGINDDGSGVIAQLEVAKYLTKYKVNNAVRFSFWTAEEFGLVGSEYYIANLPKAEQDKIRLYLNFDMIASPNYIFGIYDGDGSGFNLTGPAGSDQIEWLFEKYYKSVGENFVPTEFSGRSDYGPFLDVGIASGGLFTGAEGIKTEEEVKLFGGKVGEWYDPNYHQKGDSFKNIDLKAFYVNTGAVAHSVATYAKSLKGFPKRNATATPTRRRHIDHDEEVHLLAEGHTKEVHSCGHKAIAI